MILIEVRINKEVRDYQENLFFGLSLRQLIFALLAILVAVGVYFGLKNVVGTGEIGWMCVLAAFPFAMLMDKVMDSSNSVVQERYITLSVHRKSVDEARTFFDRMTADVTNRLNHLDAHGEELDAVERLRVLHDFYRTGEETEYHMDLRDLMVKGHSFKDSICPDSLEFKKDHFVIC